MAGDIWADNFQLFSFLSHLNHLLQGSVLLWDDGECRFFVHKKLIGNNIFGAKGKQLNMEKACQVLTNTIQPIFCAIYHMLNFSDYLRII